MSLLANANRDSQSSPRAFTAADFMPTWTAPKPQSWQDMKLIAKALTAQYGGTVHTT